MGELHNEKILTAVKTSLTIMEAFPKSKNNQPFLRLQNGRKLFFNIFIEKYGLNGEKTKYSNLDILRRIRLVEFFMYFTRNFPITRKEFRKGKEQYIIESKFYRMVILNTKDKKGASKLELLSFYHYQQKKLSPPVKDFSPTVNGRAVPLLSCRYCTKKKTEYQEKILY